MYLTRHFSKLLIFLLVENLFNYLINEFFFSSEKQWSKVMENIGEERINSKRRNKIIKRRKEKE